MVSLPLRGLPLFLVEVTPSGVLSLPAGRPRLRGRLVPGGASRLTVQYDPKPGSVTGRVWRSKRRLSER